MKGILVALWATLFFGVSIAFAQGDITPPEVVEITLEPAHVHTAISAQTISVTAHITDDLSGVAWAFFQFHHWPSGQTQQTEYQPPSCPTCSGFGWLVSGDEHDGVFGGHLELPQFAAEGWWELRYLSVGDKVGNRVDIWFDENGQVECPSDCPDIPEALQGIRFYNGESVPDLTPTPTDEPTATPTEVSNETPTFTPTPTDESTPTPTEVPDETPTSTTTPEPTPDGEPTGTAARIFIPTISHHFLVPDDPGHDFPFTVGGEQCDPNAGQTYFQGFVRDSNNNPLNGVCVHIHFYEPRNTKCSGCDGVGDGVWGFSPFGGPAPPGTPVEIYVVACEGPMPQGGQTAQTGFGDLTPQSPKWTRVIHESEQCTGITFYRR